MAEIVSPITRQVTKESGVGGTSSGDINLKDVEDCLVYDRHGASVPFQTLYEDRKSVIVFVRVGKISVRLNVTVTADSFEAVVPEVVFGN